jgi:hypothetical protein
MLSYYSVVAIDSHEVKAMNNLRVFLKDTSESHKLIQCFVSFHKTMVFL